MTTGADATSLELLAGYECPECGPMVDPDRGAFTETEADSILGGDELGFVRCPDCDCELEPTFEAALDRLALIAERFPELRP